MICSRISCCLQSVLLDCSLKNLGLSLFRRNVSRKFTVKSVFQRSTRKTLVGLRRVFSYTTYSVDWGSIFVGSLENYLVSWVVSQKKPNLRVLNSPRTVQAHSNNIFKISFQLLITLSPEKVVEFKVGSCKEVSVFDGLFCILTHKCDVCDRKWEKRKGGDA